MKMGDIFTSSETTDMFTPLMISMILSCYIELHRRFSQSLSLPEFRPLAIRDILSCDWLTNSYLQIYQSGPKPLIPWDQRTNSLLLQTNDSPFIIWNSFISENFKINDLYLYSRILTK